MEHVHEVVSTFLRAEELGMLQVGVEEGFLLSEATLIRELLQFYLFAFFVLVVRDQVVLLLARAPEIVGFEDSLLWVDVGARRHHAAGLRAIGVGCFIHLHTRHCFVVSDSEGDVHPLFLQFHCQLDYFCQVIPSNVQHS